jgi:hypothetical protein
MPLRAAKHRKSHEWMKSSMTDPGGNLVFDI